MKIALSVWNDSISTVFDAADDVLVIDDKLENIKERSMMTVKGLNLSKRANRLKEKGIDVLICGAISKPLEQMLESMGIAVFSFIRGKVEDVIAAFLEGNLGHISFSLPGCRHRRRMGKVKRFCLRGSANQDEEGNVEYAGRR